MSTVNLNEFTIDQLRAEVDARQRNLSGLESLLEVDTDELIAAVRMSQKAIYGLDDRQDLFEVTDEAILQDADSVAAIFRAADVVANPNNTFTLNTQQYGSAYGLCNGERFFRQQIGAFCTAFLVGSRLVATAGHCVTNASLPNIRFVFGFRMQNAQTATTVVNANEVYLGTSIVGRHEDSNGADWALVRLNRAVNNHRIAQLRLYGRVNQLQTVHVIGHPCGLPLKYAPGAVVRDNSPASHFVANLDTYGGNSGSPVFNSATHEVEGILVRGETDFASKASGCRVSLVCPNTGCQGEDCTRTTLLRTAISPFSDKIDAAVNWNNGKAYFFCGNRYIRVNTDEHPNNTIDPDYPKEITNARWPGWEDVGFHSGIDAAVNWGNGKAYLFKGNKYIRVNTGEYPNNTIDPHYPKEITNDRWPGWEDVGFHTGISAAVNWANGKAYFFKGNKYIRVNMSEYPNNTIDPGYPKEITNGRWPGWEDVGFHTGIDAAVNWGNGKAYIVKGDEYLRIVVAENPNNVIDGSYPKKLPVLIHF